MKSTHYRVTTKTMLFGWSAVWGLYCRVWGFENMHGWPFWGATALGFALLVVGNSILNLHSKRVVRACAKALKDAVETGSGSVTTRGL